LSSHDRAHALTFNQRVAGSIPAALTTKTANKSRELAALGRKLVALESRLWAQFWALFVCPTPRECHGADPGNRDARVARALVEAQARSLQKTLGPVRGKREGVVAEVERERGIRILELDPVFGWYSNDPVDLPTALVVWTWR
jgi:hypothetical protein